METRLNADPPQKALPLSVTRVPTVLLNNTLANSAGG